MDLIDAIVNNNGNKVFELLSFGADVILCDDSDNITPLHHAVSTAKIEIIFMLIEFGADPYKRYSETEQTAFELACLLNRFDAVSLFSNLRKSTERH